MSRTYSKLIFFGIIIVLILSGCARTNQFTQSIELGEVESQALQNEKDRIEQSALRFKETMDKDYADGLYFEDLEETRQRLNRELEAFAEKELESKWGGTFIVKADPGYYRSTLKKARDNNLSIEALGLSLPLDPIVARMPWQEREEFKLRTGGRVMIYGFMDRALNEKEKKQFNQDCYDVGGPEDAYFIYPESVLKTYSKEQIQAMEFPLAKLQKVGDYIFSEMVNFEASSTESTGLEIVKKTEQLLGERYRKQFVLLNSNQGLTIALDEPEVLFQACVIHSDRSFLRDMYLNVQAQLRMSRQMYQLIDEAGLGETMVQYTAVSNSNLDSGAYDFSGNPDDRTFINEGYAKWYSTLLIYLLAPGEEADYGKIQQVIKTSDGLFDNSERTHRIDVCFYTVSPEQRIIARDLFRNDLAPDRYDRGDNLAAQLALLTVIHSDTEGFRYLDVYCERQPIYAELASRSDPNLSQAEFRDTYFKPR